MSYADVQYHKLLEELVNKMESEGLTENRTETNATNIFGYQMRFDLTKGFPILTTKNVHFKSVLVELLWFLKGDTNIQYLLENKVRIWTDWRYKAYMQDHAKRATPNSPEPLSMAEFENLVINDPTIAEAYGDIGKGYGHQWRNFGEVKGFSYYNDYRQLRQYNGVKGFDQISWIINEIKTNPKSRRLIVSGWNPHEVDKVDLPLCHTLFQFHVQDGKLSCQLYQRSADVFLGVPFNIASYALLTQMIAQVCGLGLGEFIWTGGNVHLYENHLSQAKDQLVRNPAWHDCPKLTIDTEGKTIFEITEDDVHLSDYAHFPAIKAPVAV